ncbi:MAG TPA: hypothetical protein VFE41_14475 [Acetobacteraceae bacterium]|jgi:hypothetical protein|nr:hypothetical protein [Acetobacteraceae bacterium]
MFRAGLTPAALPVLLAVAGCGSAPPPATQLTIQSVGPPTATVMAPGPPPPAQAEWVPLPPAGVGPVVWQPGHWRFSAVNGGSWVWMAGGYVPPPNGQTAWIPGRWMQQPTGGWVWIEGHWA